MNYDISPDDIIKIEPENIDYKIDLIKKNFVSKTKTPEGKILITIFVYSDKLYERDYIGSIGLVTHYPDFVRMQLKYKKEKDMTFEVESRVRYDAILKGEEVEIEELQIPTNARFVPPDSYTYDDDKDPLVIFINKLDSNEDFTDEEKLFLDSIFNDSEEDNPLLPHSVNPANSSQFHPHNVKEYFGITESEYWQREKEYLANEDEDYPYFVASLLNTYSPHLKPISSTPRTSTYDLLFCHLIKTTKKISALRFLPQVQELYTKHFISCPFSENTMTRALNDEGCTKMLEDLLALSITPFVGIDKEYAIDSSGFTATAYAQWFRVKYPPKSKNNKSQDIDTTTNTATITGTDTNTEKSQKRISRHSQRTQEAKQNIKEEKEYKKKPWLKASIIVGRISHAVFSLDLTDTHGIGTGDPSRFEKTVEKALKYLRDEDTVITADKAYGVYHVYDYMEDVGYRFVCEFKSNATGRTDCHAMNKAYHYRYAHPEIFREFYNGRNNVESVFSTIKAKVGEQIFAENEIAIKNEMYCKMIAYNLLVLIRLYYMCGIQIEFKDKDKTCT